MANKENDEPTRQRRSIDPDAAKGNQQAATTRMADKSAPGPTIIHTDLSRPASPHTVIHRSGEAAEPFHPVTGWLVAVAGPGKGKSRPVFEGMNSAGRDPGQGIPLDFGDQEISREKHFFVTYERRKRSFHISNGEKTNLVYLNGEVVLGPMVLTEGSEIEVGKTKLRFVPLCGPGFSWDED
jgi:hypothetical protein